MEEYLDDKEQWERVLAWVREQGPWVLAGVGLALAIFGGWRYWEGRQQQRDLTASARYERVLDAFGRNDVAAGVGLADGVVKAFPGTGYADQANLAAARVEVENKQLDKAAVRLQQVLSGTKDPELALIVRLRLGRVQLAQGKSDDALKTLDAVSPGAFAARFAEVRGEALQAKGDRDGALKAYRDARDHADSTLDTNLLDLKIGELSRS
ncbi:MAG TPA: tetratricopeptide repeat protein [Steroidobacteraceae bacterium]